jgi:hypothetical protein
MAGKGKRVTFHGAFTSKRDAVAKERSIGGFIRSMKIRGRKRYVVMKKRKG